MEKNYLSISQEKCFIAIEKKFLDSISNLEGVCLKKNSFSNVIWEYHKNKKKGFILYLDLFISNAPIKFSNKGILMLKNFEDISFGIFTNNQVYTYKTTENKKIPINEKFFKLLPKNLLTGVFTGMYKKGGKPILCLDITKCFFAYKHFI